ncbi:tyrosine-type recombinase/integrase [Curtobacterium sp. MCBA15_004]|uniref:tyrosine-type recombinase/integrase n=1 Tax=Curtobacterium sp. MCBA15_004 TaxID=1898733 RepID=UPI0008DCF866|nr:tyrosine-type recombinase/integrase [Curtobacterium sp. MCBA15_004]WIA95845.1 tyrosine-type recombinase/integrase [Curtobacterium sp. MCBA15_004]
MATVTPYETAKGKRYRVRYRKPDGSQTDKRGFTTKREAELYAATVRVKKASGDYIDPAAGRETVAALGARWLASRAHLKASSLAVYESAWRLHVEPRWGRVNVASIDHSDVQDWIIELGAGDPRAKPKPIKPKSPALVRRCHDILAGILDVAVKDKKIGTNRARGVTLPRKVSKEHTYLSHQELAALVKAAGGINGQVVAVLAYTGLRWGELSALRVKDVDRMKRRLSIVQNAVYVSGQVVVGTPKTHQKRSVPFPAFLSPVFDAACRGKAGSDLVFVGPDRSFMLTPTMRDASWWDRALAAASLSPTMTIHGLRHTAASLAISAGANVKAVQKMLGHASAAMTLDTYADLFDDDLNSVADALDAAAGPNVGSLWAEQS